MTETISSAGNPVVKRMRLLADRKHRRKQGAFVVEGIQPVWRAVEAGWAIEVLITAPELITNPAVSQLITDQERRGTRVARLSRELFLRLSERDGPAGIAAIVGARSYKLDQLSVTATSVFAALHSVSNPGNLGTVIRTVDAVGGAGVVVIGDTADEFAPAAVKASMGSVFAIRVARAATEEEFFDWAALHDVCVVATSGAAEHDHWHAPYRTPLAVLLGNEGEGLPRSALERADLQVRIPMVGTAESLNLAAAAAITLYEARRNAPDLMEDAGRARASLR